MEGFDNFCLDIVVELAGGGSMAVAVGVAVALALAQINFEQQTQ